MDHSELAKARADLIAKHGAWTAHNIRLTDDVYTIGKDVVGDAANARRVLQVVADLSRRPVGELRVLDLACLEGLYSVEMALHGAAVTGVEGREASVAKARFAKDALALGSLTFVQDDVRNVTRAKYGAFDVVLCLGILYHLDSPDVFRFVENLAELCTGVLLVDTQVSITAKVCREYQGVKYWGRWYREHKAGATEKERIGKLWASLDNMKSFWFTHSSLCNLLSACGFTSVHECRMPFDAAQYADRVMLAAVKGTRLDVRSIGPAAEVPEARRPEKISARLDPCQTRRGRLSAVVKKALGRS